VKRVDKSEAENVNSPMLQTSLTVTDVSNVINVKDVTDVTYVTDRH
jgi:hypothetical protein